MRRLRARTRALLAAGTALIVVALAGPGAGAAERDGRPARAAHVWLTTLDRADTLTDVGTVAFTDAVFTVPTIVVDPGRTFQTMVGFGASITDSSAAVLYSLSPDARAAAMRSLFDPATR